jgi:chromate transporter
MSQENSMAAPGQKFLEVVLVFTRLGFTAFGGPVAHIAMMREEVVTRRKWVSDEEFLDLVAATNLIPGPNSTELAIHLGFLRAGFWGLILAGLCFIFPAMLIVLALAWAYVQYGALPEVGGLLYGMKPVVVAVVLQALFGLGKTTLKTPILILIGLAVAVASYFGVPELWLVFIPGLVLALATKRKQKTSQGLKHVLLAAGLIVTLGLVAFSLASLAVERQPFSLDSLFAVFLKVGSVLYGSGYVLLSYLNTDLVSRLGWLTRRQLLDAVSVGQFTPGPVFTTATFVGYLLGGWKGALVATLAIFLPSFVLVGLTSRGLQKLRDSEVAKGFLSGVGAASIGLMVAVMVKLGRDALVDPVTAILFVASAAILLKTKINSFWLVLAGGLVGLAKTYFHL